MLGETARVVVAVELQQQRRRAGRGLPVMCEVRGVMHQVEACFNWRRLEDLGEFVAESMVNHAAGPQGREGWKQGPR
jgi:hypothetical protein